MVINYRHINKKKKKLKKVIINTIFIVIIAILAYGLYLLVSPLINPDDAKHDNDHNITDSTVYVSLPKATKIRALVDDYNITGSIWMLVNKTSPISVDYAPSVSIPDVATNSSKSDDEQSLSTNILTPIKDLFNAAANSGLSLMIASGYRPSSLQEYYYNSAVNAYGETEANRLTAKPGQSEHQTGLAADISSVSRECYIESCFAQTAEGIWLANNSYKYGFTLRYPSGKESITGYDYEPWHFRYVGVDLATALYQSGLTLEEAWPYLQTARQSLIDTHAI